jgi:PilZ domain
MNRPAMANQLESGFHRIQLPIAPDRRRLDRVLTNLPIRIVAVEGEPAYYPGICTNLSRGGVGFETAARLDVGKVVEFEFVQVVDESMSYWIRILFRSEQRYGGYYVNDDGSDIRAPN